MPYCNYLDTRYLRRVKKRKLLKSFIYIVPDNGEKIIVSKNFISDGASIPKVFRWIIGGPWHDDSFEPSVIHDYLCVLASKNKYSRERADSVFSQALAENKVFPLKRKVMWFGVRLETIFGKKK